MVANNFGKIRNHLSTSPFSYLSAFETYAVPVIGQLDFADL